MTLNESLAALMRDHHLPATTVFGLGMYWRRLLLGYREPEPEESSIEREMSEQEIDRMMREKLSRFKSGHSWHKKK